MPVSMKMRVTHISVIEDIRIRAAIEESTDRERLRRTLVTFR